MATIITRAGKGSPLTNTEVDANFVNLNADKLETSLKGAVNGLAELDEDGYVDIEQTQPREVVSVYNNTGVTLSKGSVVYITGSHGSELTIALADSSSEIASSKTMGLLLDNVSNFQVGKVVTFGLLKGIDTSTYNLGDALWLSSSPGQLTAVKPDSPEHLVFIGYVVNNVVNGVIFIAIQNGFELEELHNVLISSLADNDFVLYEAASGLFKNKSTSSVLSILGLTDALTDADIGVNVQAYDSTILNDSDIGVNVQAYNANTALTTDITYETLDSAGDVGTGVGQLAIGNHNHSGVYEPADATILKDADIGVNVQAYNANTALTTDITYETLNSAGDVGTGAGQLAIGNHDHSGIYEPADATILKDADIGVTVQAYDSTILNDADIGVNVQAYNVNTALTTDITFETLNTNGDVGVNVNQLATGNHTHVGVYEPADATILKDADIGVNVQAYDADLTTWAGKTAPTGTVVGTSDTQTLTNKTLSSTILNDGYTEEVFAVTGTTPALSPTNGSIQTWTLTASSTPTSGTWNDGQSITLMIDDGTDYTITWTSLSVTWKTDGGTAPTLNTTGYTAIALWKVGSVIYGARVGDA